MPKLFKIISTGFNKRSLEASTVMINAWTYSVRLLRKLRNELFFADLARTSSESECIFQGMSGTFTGSTNPRYETNETPSVLIGPFSETGGTSSVSKSRSIGSCCTLSVFSVTASELIDPYPVATDSFSETAGKSFKHSDPSSEWIDPSSESTDSSSESTGPYPELNDSSSESTGPTPELKGNQTVNISDQKQTGSGQIDKISPDKGKDVPGRRLLFLIDAL